MRTERGVPAADTERMKRAAGRAAVEFVRPGEILGVGTGSTVAAFVDTLAETDSKPVAAVATSAETACRLDRTGIPTVPLSSVEKLGLYVDGADEIDPVGRLIKGRGGAHTLEKLVASASELFVCIADESKLVPRLGVGSVPLPLEVLEVAERQVIARVAEMGGKARRREGPVTKRCTILLDVIGLSLEDPEGLECALDAIPGVVECGLFALRRADIALIGTPDGAVRRVEFSSTTKGGRKAECDE